MANKNKRIIVYNKKTKKPIIVSPKGNTWVDSAVDIVWHFNDLNSQQKFIIEISNSKNFPTLNTWHYEEMSSRNHFNINENQTIWDILSNNGIYFFRIKVKGIIRELYSDWSEIGTLQIDSGNPKGKGIDLIQLFKSNSDEEDIKYIAESHSNTFVYSFNNESELGYYIGNNYSNNILHIINDSSGVKTFYGQITNNNKTSLFNEKIKILTSQSSNLFFVRNGEINNAFVDSSINNGIQFAFKLQSNEKITLLYDTDNSRNINYNLNIINGDYLTTHSPIPQNPSEQSHLNFLKNNFSNLNNKYNANTLKKYIFIGICKTPILQFNFNKKIDFNLIDTVNLELPIGKNLLNETVSSSYIGADSSIIDVNLNNKIKANLHNDNIKIGDNIRFISNFNSYSPQPYDSIENDVNSNYFIDPYKFQTNSYHLRNNTFKIKNIKKETNITEIELDSESNFPITACNKQYNRVGSFINGLNAFSETIEELKDDSGDVINKRYITEITCNEELSKNITNPITLNSVNSNGLSERWIAIKPKLESMYLFYPILLSSDRSVTVVSQNSIYSDFISLGWSINSDIDFYILGDVFIPSINVSIVDTTDLYAYIKFDSEMSPVSEIGYSLKKHNIVNGKDKFGHPMPYVERNISNDIINNMKWVKLSPNDNSKNFIKINLALNESVDDISSYEIFSDCKNSSGAIASLGDVKNTNTVCFKANTFYFGIKDNKNINDDGNLKLNNNTKHAQSTNLVADLFEITDNNYIDYFRISEFNPNALINTDINNSLISDMNFYSYIFSPSLYWKQWKSGARYKLRALINSENSIQVQENGIKYFIINIQRDVPQDYVKKETEIFITDLKDIRYDIIGSFLYLNNSNISYPIIGIDSKATSQNVPASQFDYIYYDQIILLGEPDPRIINNTEFTITTSHTWPNKTFNDNGFFTTHTIKEKNNQNNNTMYELLDVSVDRSINYTDGNGILSHIDLSSYDASNTTITSQWNGWFWTEYDSEYNLFLKCSNNEVAVFFERDHTTSNNSSSNADQVNKGVYTNWDMGEEKVLDKQSLPKKYSISSNGQLTESRYTKKFNRGWNKINIISSCPLDLSTSKATGEISLSYKSDVLDDKYKTDSGWNLPLIIYNSISEEENSFNISSIGDSIKYEKNSLQGKKCLVKILNAKNGQPLSNLSESSSGYESYESSNDSLSVLNLNENSLIMNSDDPLFVQRTGDFNVFPIYIGAFDINEISPYNKIPFITKREESQELIYLNNSAKYENSYRLSKYVFEIAGNEENKIILNPIISGTVTRVSRLNDELINIYDSSNSWQSDLLIGLPIKINGNTYIIQSNGSNHIRIKYNTNDQELLLNSSYTIGNIKDVFNTPSDNIYIYIPIGQHKQIIGDDNVVRNTSKAYVDIYDISGNSRIFNKAISLKNVIIDDNDSGYTGSVIEIDAISQKILSLYNISGQVYDANEVEEIVGVYESNPISSPTGFAYWKTLSWTEYRPDGTEVEFYIKTAETEDELKTKEYNEDAYGNKQPPYTSKHFDVPINSPNAINITNFSTDGTKLPNNEIKRLRWIQFKVILKSKKTNITPTVGNIKITYTTSEESIIPIVNQTLKGNIIRGILTANMEIPEGTNIIWGINTSDETDFNKYQVIPVNEAFEVLEPQKQFRIAAKLISSGSSTPKIYSATFLYDSDGESDLLNEKL